MILANLKPDRAAVEENAIPSTKGRVASLATSRNAPPLRRCLRPADGRQNDAAIALHRLDLEPLPERE